VHNSAAARCLSALLTLEHVAEKFFHRSVADRATEKQILDAFWRYKSQQRQQQQQPTKSAPENH